MADLPETITIHYRRATALRYGENPHQAAAVYAAEGAFLLSDSFFPEPDSVQAAREHGIRLIVQQGGSVRDKVCIAESLADTDELRAAGATPIPMVITGQRCFYHGV
jgi:phosphoribosylaminoimidazolecarboxamide formyltransferase/IMP cyclohydrolase